MKQSELNIIIEKHQKWLNKEPGGEQANLREADLSGANLRGTCLDGANLREADLSGADLCEADLSGADLYGADLCVANLRKADLRKANLIGANLYGACLDGANLRGTCLDGADLREADLSGADLCGANFYGTCLDGADLDVKHPPSNSHEFIAEVLFRESNNFKERTWAGCIKISTDWCWYDFLNNCSEEMISWAKKILCDKWPEFEERFK